MKFEDLSKEEQAAVIKMHELYETAVKNPTVVTPLGWSLYRTWKYYDSLKRKGAKKNDNIQGH